MTSLSGALKAYQQKQRNHEDNATATTTATTTRAHNGRYSPVHKDPPPHHAGNDQDPKFPTTSYQYGRKRTSRGRKKVGKKLPGTRRRLSTRPIPAKNTNSHSTNSHNTKNMDQPIPTHSYKNKVSPNSIFFLMMNYGMTCDIHVIATVVYDYDHAHDTVVSPSPPSTSHPPSSIHTIQLTETNTSPNPSKTFQRQNTNSRVIII